MFAHILSAVDDSSCAAAALDLAINLARALGAKLTIVHVIDPTKAAPLVQDPYGSSMVPWIDVLNDEAKELLLRAQTQAKEAGVIADTESRAGGPVEEIVDAALRHGCDLIVIGSHGRSGLSRLVLGSVAEGVTRTAQSPTLIVRDQKTAPSEPQEAARTSE
jgi:nucleotide-binding universal stress UspA family protein